MTLNTTIKKYWWLYMAEATGWSRLWTVWNLVLKDGPSKPHLLVLTALQNHLVFSSPLNQQNVTEIILFLLWTQSLYLMPFYYLEALSYHTEKRESQTTKRRQMLCLVIPVWGFQMWVRHLESPQGDCSSQQPMQQKTTQLETQEFRWWQNEGCS